MTLPIMNVVRIIQENPRPRQTALAPQETPSPLFLMPIPKAGPGTEFWWIQGPTKKPEGQ